jgi:hypothetical protein
LKLLAGRPSAGDTEMLGDSSAAGLAELLAQFLILQEPGDRRCKRFVIARFNQQPGLVRNDGFGDAAGRRADDRMAHRHGVEDRRSQTLGDR